MDAFARLTDLLALLGDSAIDPPALRDSLADLARRLLAGGLAAEVVES